MFEFAIPTAVLAQRRNNLAPWDGIFGLQKFVDDLSDRLLPGPAIKALATRRPMQNAAFQIMDDDVGQIQDLDERVEFGAHSRSHPFGVVFATDTLIKLHHFGPVTIRSNVAILWLRGSAMS